MRKPVVDYRSFRFSKIREPEYRHLLFLLGWVGYFIMYFLTERFIPYEKCTPVHIPLDDIVPFCEVFVIPYVGWYFLIVGSLVYFALYNPDHFKRMNTFIITTQIVAMITYVLFPNRQDFRPEVFPRENVFTYILDLIYTADTCTNVCPSMHVAYSIGIASTWLKEKSASRWCKALITAFCFLVCISVAFVKQHSTLDIFAAIPVCVLAEWITFGRSFWLPKFKKQ